MKNTLSFEDVKAVKLTVGEDNFILVNGKIYSENGKGHLIPVKKLPEALQALLSLISTEDNKPEVKPKKRTAAKRRTRKPKEVTPIVSEIKVVKEESKSNKIAKEGPKPIPDISKSNKVEKVDPTIASEYNEFS